MTRKKKETPKPKIEETVEKTTPTSKEIIQEIIKRLEAEKFVDVIVIDAPTYGHNFKDYTDEFKTSTKEFEKFVAVGTFQVSCSVTQKQVQELREKWDIDVTAMVENVLMNEASIAVLKQLIARITEVARKNYLDDYTRLDKLKVKAYNFANKFRRKNPLSGEVIKVEYQKKTKIKSVEQLLKLILRESIVIDRNGKWGYGDFAICSIKTATMLQQHSQYTMLPQEEISANSGVRLWPFGKIAGITVYVDPFMLYEDHNIYIGKKTNRDEPGIKAFAYTDSVETQLVVKGTDAPKIAYRIRYAIVNVGESCKHLYRKIDYKDDRKYPII